RLKKLVLKNGVHKLAYEVFAKDRTPDPVLKTLDMVDVIAKTGMKFDHLVWLYYNGPMGPNPAENRQIRLKKAIQKNGVHKLVYSVFAKDWTPKPVLSAYKTQPIVSYAENEIIWFLENVSHGSSLFEFKQLASTHFTWRLYFDEMDANPTFLWKKMISENRLKKLLQKNGVYKLVYSVFAKDWTPEPKLESYKPRPMVGFTQNEFIWFFETVPKGTTYVEGKRNVMLFFQWLLYRQQTHEIPTILWTKMISEKRLKKAIQKNGVHKLVYSVFAKDWTPEPELETYRPQPVVSLTKSEFMWFFGTVPMDTIKAVAVRNAMVFFQWLSYHQQMHEKHLYQRLCVPKMMSEKRLKKLVQKNGYYKLVYSVFAKDWTPDPTLRTYKRQPTAIMTELDLLVMIKNIPKVTTTAAVHRITDAYFGWFSHLQQTDKCFTHFIKDWYKEHEMYDLIQIGPNVSPSGHM
ncbi:unnamed protein product, partial [Medioppia subpectinata]